MFHVPNQCRIKNHPLLSSDDSFGNNGAFKIPLNESVYAFVIASDGEGWEHVSVHIIDNNDSEMPTWDEMCAIKALFWDKEDCVLQYHPPESEYVNNHPFVLHLWRPIGVTMPAPPAHLVGLKKNM